MGVANVGLLSTIGYYAYTRRNVPWDRNYVGATAASVLALFGIEGVVAEQFANTPEGREEIERAKQEGSKFYVNAREVVLRPGVAGGLLGAVNVAVLGAGESSSASGLQVVSLRSFLADLAFSCLSLSLFFLILRARPISRLPRIPELGPKGLGPQDRGRDRIRSDQFERRRGSRWKRLETEARGQGLSLSLSSSF